MKRIAILLFVGVLACAAVALLSTTQSAPVIADDGPANSPPLGPDPSPWPVPPQPGSILLLDDGGSPGQEGKQALDNFGYSYTHVSPAGFATVNLDAFDIIFVAWLPSQAEVDALNARKVDLANWINQGGGIVVNAENRAASQRIGWLRRAEVSHPVKRGRDARSR